MTQDDDRKRRLAQALRDNLRRRKGQARDVAAASEPAEGEADGHDNGDQRTER